MIVGIDEVGRGSAIGPLVICGVAIAEDFQYKLAEIGVRDSKRITGKRKFERRANMAHEIKKIASVITENVTAGQIDKHRRDGGTLDDLERTLVSTIIRRFLGISDNIDRVICDGGLFNPLKDKYSIVECYSGADDTYPVVSAASICAKNTRDQTVKLIMGGNMSGGGYPNQRTWEWIQEDYRKYGRYSDHIRKTWSWFERMSKSWQVSLSIGKEDEKH
jgi:ribonuclease H